MGYELKYDPERDIILGRVTGTLNSEIVKQMATEVQQMIHETKCLKVLNDLRCHHKLSSVFDIYEMPKMVTGAKIPKSCKRALVVNEITDNFQFMEDTQVNAGHMVKLFTDPKSALEWLMQN
ncbi:MAG: hypothetical protein PHI97_28290 [Desulfobulbus sp.]|nr:hypothetical protein [Desulfobulbus sp.]